MYSISEKRAGDFIDLESWHAEMLTFTPGVEDEYSAEIITKFFISLIGRLFESEDECKKIFEAYMKEVEELKQGFEFIYNPPQLPSTTEKTDPTIGDEYRKEFVQMYGGYTEITYLVAITFSTTPPKVMREWTTQEFLYWGNYLLHKKYCESIK